MISIYRNFLSAITLIAAILFTTYNDAGALAFDEKINSDMEALREGMIADLMRRPVDGAQVSRLMNTIREDGTWPGIDYVDVSNTGFQHGRHLSNLVTLCRAYKMPGSDYYKSSSVKQDIDAALNYWLTNDFICENWWWNQIGTPTGLVSVLLIMDEDLSPEQVNLTLPMIGRAHLNASGARPSGDRIKIASLLAKQLLYSRDEAQFEVVIRVIEGEIKFATGRGMQYDYSFHHRVDRVNNTISYGLGYADAFAEWADKVSDTQYAFSDKALQQLIDYYLDGLCKNLVYGKYPDPGVKNRSISRPGSLHAFSIRTPERLMKTSSYRKDELEEIVRIRKDGAKPTLSFGKFFWQSEHYSHQRPDYFTSVRMFSTRNRNMEEPYNSEGLLNHHRGDGTNYISVTGTEYYDIAPVFDYQKVPGATILQKASLSSGEGIQQEGTMDFVGAASDGMYGTVAFDFVSPHDPLVARKGWFFFDRQYVCLGAGITSTADLEAVTTLNQCLLKGDVVVKSGKKKSTLAEGDRALKKVQWVHHDGVGYVFPASTKAHVSNQAATGSWWRINEQSNSSKEELSTNVFTCWLNHGSKPQNAAYEYIVVPAVTPTELEAYLSTDDIYIIANTSAVQAVRHLGLNITQIVLYQPGQVTVTAEVKVISESPGLVMIKMKGEEIEQITVADPTRKLGIMHLRVTARIEAEGKNFVAIWNEDRQESDVVIALPQDVYAGKSVTVEL